VRLADESVQPQAAARALRSVRELREALAAAFYGKVDSRPPPAADIRTLERHFLASEQHRELRWQEGRRATGNRRGMAVGSLRKEAELPVWILAERAGQLMLSDAMERVRACGADTCRWLFLDTSKNHTRRWCNMKVCGKPHEGAAVLSASRTRALIAGRIAQRSGSVHGAPLSPS